MTISCRELERPTHKQAQVNTNNTRKAKGAKVGSGSPINGFLSLSANKIKPIPIGAVNKDKPKLIGSRRINFKYL